MPTSVVAAVVAAAFSYLGGTAFTSLSMGIFLKTGQTALMVVG